MLVLQNNQFPILMNQTHHPLGALAIIDRGNLGLGCYVEGYDHLLVLTQHQDYPGVGEALPRYSPIFINSAFLFHDFADAYGGLYKDRSVEPFFTDVVGNVPLHHLASPPYMIASNAGL